MQSWTFGEEPQTLVKGSDFIPNLGIKTIDLDQSPHILVVGKSRSGKSSLISRLICNHFIHTIPFEKIIIFSPTFGEDSTYNRLRWTLRKLWEKKNSLTKQIPLSESLPSEHRNYKNYVDLELIKEIQDTQENIKKHNEMIDYQTAHGDKKKVQKKKKLEKYLIVVDDLVGAKEWSSYGSELANFCMRSRHTNLIFIWSSQVYTKVNYVI